MYRLSSFFLLFTVPWLPIEICSLFFTILSTKEPPIGTILYVVFYLVRLKHHKCDNDLATRTNYLIESNHCSSFAPTRKLINYASSGRAFVFATSMGPNAPTRNGVASVPYSISKKLQVLYNSGHTPYPHISRSNQTHDQIYLTFNSLLNCVLRSLITSIVDKSVEAKLKKKDAG